MEDKGVGIPSTVKYMSGLLLFYWLGRSAVWNFLPVFIERHISSVFLVGLVTSLPPLITLLLDIPVSNLVQRAGERVVVLSGLIAGAAPSVLYAGAVSAAIVGGKALEGVSKSLTWNGAWSLALRIPDDDVQSRSNSVFLLGPNLAKVAGPVFGGFVLASAGFRPLFAIWAGLGVLGSLTFYHIIGTGHTSIEQPIKDLVHGRTYVNDFRHLRKNLQDMRKPLALIMTYSVVNSFSWLVVPLILDKLDASFVEMGLIFTVAATPWLLQFGWGSLGDRYGEEKILGLAGLATAPVLFWLSTVSSVALLGAGYIVSRVATNGMSPLIHTLFDAAIPDEQEGEMTGFLELTKHFGQFLGPALAGAVSSLYGLSASFLGAGVVALLVAGVAVTEF